MNETDQFDAFGASVGGGTRPDYSGCHRIIRFREATFLALSTGPFCQHAILPFEQLHSYASLHDDIQFEEASHNVSTEMKRCDPDDVQYYFPTSLAVAMVSEFGIALAWTGLCFAAVIRDGRLLWKNYPHTLSSEFARLGDSRAANRLYDTIVTQCLGFDYRPPSKSPTMAVKPYDIICLCAPRLASAVEAKVSGDTDLGELTAAEIYSEIIGGVENKEQCQHSLLLLRWKPLGM